MNSIVSYPERGIGGKNSYRGNCSPKLIADLIDQFKWTEISDYMCGSGTTEDVARQKGIISHCYDLNRGFDLMTMDIPERNQAIFWHPPYADMITYAGNQYSAEEVKRKFGIDPIKSDLSQIKDWDEFVKAMNYCMMKQFSSLEKGGRMAVLMGDMKRKGKLYSMLVDIIKPGTLENIVIKAQHNCWSDSVHYSNRNFIPIQHEYLMIVRKDEPLIFGFKMTQNGQFDMRDSLNTTWRDVVAAILEKSGSAMTLQEIYEKIDGHKKCQANAHWKEKVRQTLQINNTFTNVSKGVWAIA